MDPSSLFTLSQSSYDDILSQFPDADPSTVSAEVVASGGETSSAHLNLSVRADDGAITSSATAVVEADGTTVTTTGEAAASGETASTSLDVAASVDQQGPASVFSSTANAEAKPGEGGTATASTDVEPTGVGLDEILKDQTIQTPLGDDHPTATSNTEFEAVRVDGVAFEMLDLPQEEEGIAGLWNVLDYWP